MDDRDDPVAADADESRDLYEVATWEERTSIDGAAVALYWLLTRAAKWVIVLLALAILAGIGGLAALSDPAVGMLTLLSVVPAAGLTLYVYRSDITDAEPLSLLVTTFLLSILFATFAAVFNSTAERFFQPLGILGLPLFYFLIVGPGEETVKLLAVRLYAYTDSRFDAVIDGAVYGAVAGLGFATIENALYILRQLSESGELAEITIGISAVAAGGDITAVRRLSGAGTRHLFIDRGLLSRLSQVQPRKSGADRCQGATSCGGHPRHLQLHGEHRLLCRHLDHRAAGAGWVSRLCHHLRQHLRPLLVAEALAVSTTVSGDKRLGGRQSDCRRVTTAFRGRSRSRSG